VSKRRNRHLEVSTGIEKTIYPELSSKGICAKEDESLA
jgi:hypothetical protein